MRRRIDIRRVPLTWLFFGAMLAIFLFELRSYFWLLGYSPRDFLAQALLLVPVAMFFAALGTLILWYVFRIVLPSAVRSRRLRMIRYKRSLRRRNDEGEQVQAENQ